LIKWNITGLLDIQAKIKKKIFEKVAPDKQICSGATGKRSVM